jgi:hypothetical protein
MMLVRRWGRRMSPSSLSSVLNFGEIGAIKVCLALQCLGYIGIAFSRYPGSFIISSLLVASAAPVAPLLTSCLTSHVPSDQSGQLLGLLSFLHSIARVVLPAIMSATYSMTVGYSPAPLFILLACIACLSLLATMCIKTNML